MLPLDFRYAQLRFRFKALDGVDLGDNPGSALRGALYGGLRYSYCIPAGHGDVPDAECPVCHLFATELPQGNRGKQPPRPVVIKPPIRNAFRPDEIFEVTIGAVGDAIDLFPVLVAGAGETRHLGVRRSAIELVDAQVVSAHETDNPDDSPVIDFETLVQRASTMPTDSLTLEFLTPTRLIRDGKLVHRPDLGVLVRRLVERIQSFSTAEGWQETYEVLGNIADAATLEVHETRWRDSWSGSSRTGKRSPVGGFVGTARWSGDLGPLVPWILCGSLVHVGKNAVKGYGWYRELVRPQ